MLQDQDLLSIQEARTKVDKAYAAWRSYQSFSQEQVDGVVERMGAAARTHAQRLGELAVQETGYGNAADKRAKNLLSADLLIRTMRGQRTIGILDENKQKGVVKLAVPMGVVAAVLPTTNPTSTAIYKILIALKAGNGIVLSPHPRAKRCTCETASLLAQAAAGAGAPADLIQCINEPTLEGTNALLRHPKVGVILSTGGSSIVRAAYSSGNPALGVGPGNVPVLVDTSADLGEAVAGILDGKSFDYGTICSSEQTLVAESSLRDKIIQEINGRGGYLCTAEQSKLLAARLLTPNAGVNPDCVGQPATKIASMAGFSVPPQTRVLVAEIQGVGKEHLLSAEKLSPVLALLFVKDFAEALERCEAILHFGGLGHTCGIYARDESRIRAYAQRMPAMRILVNTPTPQGSVGITTNLFPAMTLGCGALAGNITGDNIGPQHLFNVKRLAYKSRSVEEAFPSAHQPEENAMPDTVDRQTVVAAVTRYLSQRGLSPQAATAAKSAEGEASRTKPAAVSPAPTAQLVDNFLAAKLPAPPAVSAAPPASAPAPIVPAEPPAPPAKASPPLGTVDFVCENDVRTAILKKEKIHIGPKTIVTPAARDLAAAHGILVQQP